MIYSFIGFIIFSVFIIIKNHKNESAIWFFILLVGFCISVLGLTFYSVYIWDYSYIIRKLFFNLSKEIWLFIYYLNINSGTVMRMINIGSALFSYATIGLTLSIAGHNKKKTYLLLFILPTLLIVLYDPLILTALYRAFRFSKMNDYISFKTLLDSFNLFNKIWIKIYILASIGILIYGYRKYKNINFKKRVLYLMVGMIPIYIQYILLFYWVPQPFIVLRDFNVDKSIESSWEISKYLTVDFNYSRFTYIAVMLLSFISVTLLMFAIIKHNLFDINIYRSRLIFSNAYMTANQGSKVFAHSIKNQLVTIRMLSESLEKSLKNDHGSNETVKEISTICNETIEKLDTLWDMSKPLRLHLKLTNVGEFFEKRILKRIHIKEGIKLNLDNSNTFPALIDRDTFEEAAVNIIQNAIESLDNCNEGSIDISFEVEMKWGIVNIKDNGRGISKENLSKIFTPFFSTKPTTSNWGIGLSFCKNAIEALGGEIQVISEIDKGTLLKMFIPLYRGEA